jgi:hypothetical protein
MPDNSQDFWDLIAFNYPDQKHLWSDHVNADRQDS